jgi:uncharacterized protein
LHLKIAAPPVEGKANLELIKYLSKLLDIRKRNILIEKGINGRRKIVTIGGIEIDEFKRKIVEYQTD